jgi:hypothetical protein
LTLKLSMVRRHILGYVRQFLCWDMNTWLLRSENFVLTQIPTEFRLHTKSIRSKTGRV